MNSHIIDSELLSLYDTSGKTLTRYRPALPEVCPPLSLNSKTVKHIKLTERYINPDAC